MNNKRQTLPRNFIIMNPLLTHCIYCIRNCKNEFQIECLIRKYNNKFHSTDHVVFVSEVVAQLDFLRLTINDVLL